MPTLRRTANTLILGLVSCNSDSLNKSAYMSCGRALGEARDARQDLVGAFGPHERRGLLVADVDEFPDSTLEFADTTMGASPQLFGRQFTEPALDQVQPRAVGGGEVHMKAGAF